jgi:hypothetical protein
MLRPFLAVIGALSIASAAAAQDDCRYEAPRSGSVSASGARQLLVEAGSGSLRVEGRPGLSEVRVRGRACASSQDLLDRLDFDIDRSGGGVRVVTREVDMDGWNAERRYARLDLVIEVPAGIEAEIRDGSGSAEILSLGATRIHDGSGSLHVEDIRGLLDIEDGSGELTVRNVEGDVVIDDGSGEVEIADVRGSTTIGDGSGDIRVSGVGRNVRIADSSGGIDVDTVRGDFTVSDDGSGGIRHRGVSGTVDIPQPRRRGR